MEFEHSTVVGTTMKSLPLSKKWFSAVSCSNVALRMIRSRDHRFRDKMPCRRTGLTRRQLPRWERPRSLVLTLCIGEDLFNSHTTVQLNFLYRDTHRSLSYDCFTMHSLLSLNVPFLWCKHLFLRISNCRTAAILLPLITPPQFGIRRH